MKTIFVSVLILVSAPALAANQLTCKVSETVYPPLQDSSVNYTLTSQLNPADENARIDAQAKSLDLSYGFETFLDSEGRQVVLVGATEMGGGGSSTYGQNFAQMFFDTKDGSLFVECSVK